MRLVSCLLPGLLLVLGPSAYGAGAEHQPVEKYKVTIHGPDGEKELPGLSAAQAAEHVRSGAASHVVEDKPVNVLEIRWDLGLWTVVVFLLLLYVLSKIAWKPMLEGLKKREQNISAAIEESKAARAEAQHLRDHLAQERAKMADEVRKALDEAREDARRLKEETLASARQEIQADRDRLRRELDLARDQAVKELWDQAAQLATLISAKAIGRNISEQDHHRLLDEALADLNRAGSDRQRETAAMRG